MNENIFCIYTLASKMGQIIKKMHVIMLITKYQLISKGNFDVFNSPKTRTWKFLFLP